MADSDSLKGRRLLKTVRAYLDDPDYVEFERKFIEGGRELLPNKGVTPPANHLVRIFDPETEPIVSSQNEKSRWVSLAAPDNRMFPRFRATGWAKVPEFGRHLEITWEALCRPAPAQVEHSGQPQESPPRSAPESVASSLLSATGSSEETGNQYLAPFSEMRDFQWRSVQMTFITLDEITVRAGGLKGTYHFSDLGLRFRDTSEAKTEWKLLRLLARFHGELPRNYDTSHITKNGKAQFSNLRQTLRRHFPFEGWPIWPQDRVLTYRTSFTLELGPNLREDDPQVTTREQEIEVLRQEQIEDAKADAEAVRASKKKPTLAEIEGHDNDWWRKRQN